MYKVLTPNIKLPYKFLLAYGHFLDSFGCYRVQWVKMIRSRLFYMLTAGSTLTEMGCQNRISSIA